jgi:ribonuclease HI/uncharacterized phage-like protein YoqJ
MTTATTATTAYTDGACLGNPGPGGWAWAVPGGPFASGAETHTTNQRMEIAAALEAVRAIPGPLDVVSDSTYVVNCFRDRWWEGWLKRDWHNSQKKPVANRDLWEPLIELVRSRAGGPDRVTFQWVKGHSDDPMNDLVDRLAVEAATNGAGRSGDAPPGPDELGPPDSPAARARARARSGGSAAGDDAPAGRRVAIVGHRPPELGGYGDNDIAESVRSRLAAILAVKKVLHPDLVVLTGLGLGAEQLGAEAAVAADVPFVAVLPFPEQDTVWSAPLQRRYRELLERAADVETVTATKPASRTAVLGALARRNAWLARHADEAIAVWDGEDAAVGKLVRSLRDHLGEEEVWLLPPNG